MFLLACAALAVVLLLSARAPATDVPPATPLPASTAASAPTARPAQGLLPTAGPAGQVTQPPLRASVTALEPGYTVQQGDNLGSIAARFGTTVEALRAYNRLEDAAVLRIGQKLIVPER